MLLTMRQMYVKIAEQGVRQKGYPSTKGQKILEHKDMFYSTRYPNKPEVFSIPEHCVGLVHDGEQEISIVYKDSQATRRFIRKLNP